MASSVLQNLVGSLKLETSWTPPIEIADPFAPAPPNPFLSIVRPKVTITTASGDPLVMAPYGEPEDNWPYLKWVLLAGGALALYGAVSFAWKHWSKAYDQAGFKGVGLVPEEHAAVSGRLLARAAESVDSAGAALQRGACPLALTSLINAARVTAVASANLSAASSRSASYASEATMRRMREAVGRIDRLQELFATTCVKR